MTSDGKFFKTRRETTHTVNSERSADCNTYGALLYRQHFPPEVAAQLKRPLHFVDFLREPVTDPETGEVIDAHPSVYESVVGGLPDIR